MRACVAACLSSVLALAATLGAQPAPPQAIVSRYCVSCHNGRLKTGGLALDAFDLSRVADHSDVWEKVVRKLRADAMPPAGAARPDAATSDGLRAWLETQLDTASAAAPSPGRPLLHRLNRAEYANAIRDLLALDVDASSLLPPDDSSYGFDNVADVLGVSPVLLERYLTAANRVASLAVGEPGIVPGTEIYRARQDLSQDQHIEGLPLGTIGGMQARHTFPLDAEYVLQIKLFRTNLNAIRGTEFPHQLEVTVDGERVFFDTVGGTVDATAVFGNPTNASDAIDARLKARVRIAAGPHVIGVAFLRDISEGTRHLQPFVRSSADTYDITGRPHVSSVAIAGPYNATGSGDTPSRRRIFTCRSGSPCARQIVATLARRAFRRPVTAKDLDPLMKFYQDGLRDPSAGSGQAAFERGIQFALERILASPEFAFRAEPDPPGVEPGAVYRLGDLALASRLSFFLWSSIPDDELLTLASQGTLSRADIFDRQVRRMLADPRSDALVKNFAGQWLQLRNLNSAQPNSTEFPDFDDNLRQGFRRETEMLFDTVMRENRSVLELLTADFTFVNERLARHYGIPNVYGSQLRRVPVTDPARRGILGHGSILTVTSHADRTSPVVRGKWILENLLGVPPPPPLPGAGVLKDDGDETVAKTMRERMEKHRANPECASCHRLMDPLGFALENFDAVGAWRTKEAGKPIDTAGQLVSGAKVDGVVALREALLKRPEVFVSTMTEKLLVYALGRGLDAPDMPTVRTIVRDASAGGYRFSSLVLGITNSVPFRMRTRSAGL